MTNYKCIIYRPDIPEEELQELCFKYNLMKNVSLHRIKLIIKQTVETYSEFGVIIGKGTGNLYSTHEYKIKKHSNVSKKALIKNEDYTINIVYNEFHKIKNRKGLLKLL